MARRDEREYREYLNEEQRSQPGCSAGRMQLEFHHGLLAEPISTLIGGGEIASRVRRLLDDRTLAPSGARGRIWIALAAAAIVAIGAVYSPLLHAVHYATELLVQSLP